MNPLLINQWLFIFGFVRLCEGLFSRFQRVYEVHKTQNLNFSLPNPTTPTTVAVEGTEHTIAT